MREVGAAETENEFRSLLDLVEKGEEVAITRSGKEVARLVPTRPSAKAAERVQLSRAFANRRSSTSSGRSI